MFLKKLFILTIGLFLCFVLVFLANLIKSIYGFDDLNHTVIVNTSNFKDKQSIDFLKDKNIFGEFKSKYNNLGIVSIKFNTHNKINTDFLEFRIKEKDKDDWFYTAKYKVDQFQNNKYFPFGFPEISDSKNKKYEFEITSLNGEIDNYVSIDSGNNQFLIKNSFSKKFLSENKTCIPVFVFNKILSLFKHINSVGYLFIVLQSIIVYIVFSLLINLFLLVISRVKKKSIDLIKIKKEFFFKDHIFECIFFFISFAIFIFLLLNPQRLCYDAGLYYGLGRRIFFENGFNVIKTNLEMRTYAFPLIISFLIYIANLFRLDVMSVIYFANYFLFIISILLIHKVLSKKSIKIGKIFLLINSINLINLSFVNTVLTESLMIFLISALFYILCTWKNTRMNTFFSGLVIAFSVMVRPSNLFLFLIFTVFVVIKSIKKPINLFHYFVPILFLFSISFLNVYQNEGNFSLFTTQTSGIYNMQIRGGVKIFKYETSVDQKLKYPSVYFRNKKSEVFVSQECSNAVGCFLVYLKTNPVDYISISLIHTFALFDRMYMNTYVEDINKIDGLMVFYNYLVLSSVIGFIVFYLKKYSVKYFAILWSSLLLILGTLLIYIPTIVEARFSSPIFPLLTIFSAFYFYSLLKEKKSKRNKLICFQLLIMFIFYTISYLISQTMVL